MNIRDYFTIDSALQHYDDVLRACENSTSDKKVLERIRKKILAVQKELYDLKGAVDERIASCGQ